MTQISDTVVSDKVICESDNLVTQPEKMRPQIGDIFPTINELLNDHGIKEKLKGMNYLCQ